MNTYSEVKNGHYDIGGKDMYFRSKWEANIALYLNFLLKNKKIKSWEFEPHYIEFPIKHGTTRYLPDFLVTNANGSQEYWEVKGYMDAKSKTKLNRMKKYHPDKVVKLIDRTEYKYICDAMSKLLQFY